MYKKVRKSSRNDGDMSKRHRNQLERASTDQIWDSLSIKIIKAVMDYNPLNKTGIHKSILMK